MDNPPPNLPKKGLGPLAWIGIGCGGIIVLVVIGFVVVSVMFGGKLKQFAEDAQKNPTRTVATTMVNMSGGKIELAESDDANKRYTVREKDTGKMTTIYWDERTNSAQVIEGDFSAIPPAPTMEPATPPEEK